MGVLVYLVCAALAAVGGGCALVPLFTTYEPAPPLDFAQLQTYVNMAVDLTEMNGGRTEKSLLQQSYASDGLRVDFYFVDSVRVEYMMTTSDADRRHTLVFPGTSRVFHVLLDFQKALVFDEELGTELHRGFRTAARAVRDDVVTRIDPTYEIHVIGYSFGGATAAILAEYLRREGYDVADVVTLGQPALTTPVGARAFDELPLLRLISGDDPIVWNYSSGYAQFGEAIILLDGPYVVHLVPDSPEFSLAAGLLVGTDDEGDIDHGLYVPRIASKVGVDVYEVSFIQREQFLPLSQLEGLAPLETDASVLMP